MAVKISPVAPITQANPWGYHTGHNTATGSWELVAVLCFRVKRSSHNSLNNSTATSQHHFMKIPKT